jgi:hypothetical protein
MYIVEIPDFFNIDNKHNPIGPEPNITAVSVNFGESRL